MTEIENQAANASHPRLGGALLAVTALLSLAFVMHHPVVQAHNDIAAVAADVRSVARVDRIVHGGLMAIYGVQALGFYLFSRWLGFGRPAVAAGFLAFAAGVVVMIIPATLDGFVTPDIMEACLNAPGGCAAADASMSRLVAIMIQDFTKIALVAVSLGGACWSLALLLGKGVSNRIGGAVGFIFAGVPTFQLLFSAVYLQPGNLAGIILAQVLWSLTAASLMFLGGRFGDPGSNAKPRDDAPTEALP
jgi:hypothetical protein